MKLLRKSLKLTPTYVVKKRNYLLIIWIYFVQNMGI